MGNLHTIDGLQPIGAMPPSGQSRLIRPVLHVH